MKLPFPIGWRKPLVLVGFLLELGSLDVESYEAVIHDMFAGRVSNCVEDTCRYQFMSRLSSWRSNLSSV